ncbi:Ribonuclease P protein subunit P38-related [Striga hermonthica]|uniref:Ribonuclease P protein subunit P38-related n=1 Tax=Striga hermonthica TaxID=68872 RepID=A0A9N7MPQ5_STRHE|nr:Ribonuclease P protein subunit P38-related [Striga hermonthica]
MDEKGSSKSFIHKDTKTRDHELLQKLESAQKQIEQLKKTRSEDGKANEKVVGIFASREQIWFTEKKKLTQEIDDLVDELRALEMEKDKSISALNEKLNETEAVLLLKDKSIEQGEEKRREMEENLKKAEDLVQELRENLDRESQRHSNEILKHKTAFIELVSNQRQLKAEMGRVLRQFEAAKQELDSVLLQKDQSVLMAQRVSMELVKMRKDLEQKDQILSALLRKSKLDTDEKEMLLNDVKSSKVMRKQAEMETARWKAVMEAKPERHSLRNILYKRGNNVKSDVFLGGKGVNSKSDVLSLGTNLYLTGAADDELKMAAEIEPRDSSITSKAESYEFTIKQRHNNNNNNLEIDAFAEQLRLKDEKMETFRWRLLSTEIESKRLRAHVETLGQENLRLEALLMDRESELHSLKEQLVLQFNPPNLQKLHFGPSPPPDHETVWSKVKIIRKRPEQKRREMDAMIAEEDCRARENGKVDDEIRDHNRARDIVLTIEYPQKATQEEKKVARSSPSNIREESVGSDAAASVDTSQVTSKKTISGLKMDIQALGVSYKIKRLKQQFLMLERLTGKQESGGNSESENGPLGIKGFYALTALLNKQVDRYQSLQGKTDDLCQRMEENRLNSRCTGPTIAKTVEETKMLEQFLDETFQLQRYIVATGQKLMEVQAKISCGFVEDAEKTVMPSGFDLKRFADSIRTLFQEVQRGFEIRISRIIGDLGGTLAIDGIIHLKK